MGELIYVVIINDEYCYLIKKGHNNEERKVIEMAIDKHYVWYYKTVDELRKNDERDDTGREIWKQLSGGSIEQVKLYNIPEKEL